MNVHDLICASVCACVCEWMFRECLSLFPSRAATLHRIAGCCAKCTSTGRHRVYGSLRSSRPIRNRIANIPYFRNLHLRLRDSALLDAPRSKRNGNNSGLIVVIGSPASPVTDASTEVCESCHKVVQNLVQVVDFLEPSGYVWQVVLFEELRRHIFIGCGIIVYLSNNISKSYVRKQWAIRDGLVYMAYILQSHTLNHITS